MDSFSRFSPASINLIPDRHFPAQRLALATMSNPPPSNLPVPKPLPNTETLTDRPRTTKAQSQSTRATRMTKLEAAQAKVRNFGKLGHGLMVSWAVLAAIATGSQSHFAQLLERQIQTLFLELRGPVAPPDNIVILAMDSESLAQAEFYAADPKKYAYFASIRTTPWQRTAYAQALDRLLQAGARSVSLDVVLDRPSSYGPADDAALQAVVQKHRDRLTVAALYEDEATPQGPRTKLTFPNPTFNFSPSLIGFINYPLAPNGSIHSLADIYPQLVARTYSPEIAQDFLATSGQTVSFAEATLRAAQIPLLPAQVKAIKTLQEKNMPGQDIFFYGPQGTFPQIPFWQVLDPTEWRRLSQSGVFKDKIVLIGPTAITYQDFHAAPFSKSLLYPTPLTGIEIHANAVATLLENRAIAPAIPSALMQGLLVLGLVIVGSVAQTRYKRPLTQVFVALGSMLGVAALGYGLLNGARLSLPVAVPMGAIALSSVTYFATQSASEYLRKLQLRSALEYHSNSPIVQEIISQQDDLKDLLREREQAILGKQLAGRYTITQLLGSGGFGETYIAEDTQRPGKPQCVVKQLRPATNNPKMLQLARRLFSSEASSLEKLGSHDLIPQLLAYFEEDEEFYLVQEFVPGRSLSSELTLGCRLPEVKVVALLRELLEILDFVHSQGVIHRDIKPSNIIRRATDQKLVLIDFGAVKEIHQLADPLPDEADDGQSALTVGIGTQGYMPSEQCAGNPRFNSDLYAIGMTAIQALIGLPPSKIKTDSDGELLWKEKHLVSHALADVLSKMVRSNYKDRYQSASEALQALSMFQSSEAYVLLESPPIGLDFGDDQSETAFATSTQPWPETFGSTHTAPATAPSTSAETTSDEDTNL